MPRPANSLRDNSFLAAALEGLELQKQRIEEQIQQVRAMLGGRAVKATVTGSILDKQAKKRRLSAAARKRIAMAQKRRWAEYRKKAAAARES